MFRAVFGFKSVIFAMQIGAALSLFSLSFHLFSANWLNSCWAFDLVDKDYVTKREKDEKVPLRIAEPEMQYE